MTSSGDSAQLLASMRSVVAMHRNLGPVVTAGRLGELRAIVERECAWTNDRLEGFANMHPEANSYALMLTQIAKPLERLGESSPGLSFGTATPGGDDPASQVEAAIGGIETLARSLADRLLET